jgi:hypothetical protein
MGVHQVGPTGRWSQALALPPALQAQQPGGGPSPWQQAALRSMATAQPQQKPSETKTEVGAYDPNELANELAYELAKWGAGGGGAGGGGERG